MSKEERHALSTLQKTTTFKDGRYEVGLLWHPNVQLPNNFTAAIQQFKKMKHRLSRQPDLHAMYQDTIDKDLEKGYIRKLESHEIPKTGWILLEHGVYSHVKAKLRRESNAAAKFKERCLNDMLLVGPDLLANLVGVILCFHQKKNPGFRGYRRHVHAGFGPSSRSEISSFPLGNRRSRNVRIRPPCLRCKMLVYMC